MRDSVDFLQTIALSLGLLLSSPLMLFTRYRGCFIQAFVTYFKDMGKVLFDGQVISLSDRSRPSTPMTSAAPFRSGSHGDMDTPFVTPFEVESSFVTPNVNANPRMTVGSDDEYNKGMMQKAGQLVSYTMHRSAYNMNRLLDTVSYHICRIVISTVKLTTELLLTLLVCNCSNLLIMRDSAICKRLTFLGGSSDVNAKGVLMLRLLHSIENPPVFPLDSQARQHQESRLDTAHKAFISRVVGHQRAVGEMKSAGVTTDCSSHYKEFASRPRDCYPHICTLDCQDCINHNGGNHFVCSKDEVSAPHTLCEHESKVWFCSPFGLDYSPLLSLLGVNRCWFSKQVSRMWRSSVGITDLKGSDEEEVILSDPKCAKIESWDTWTDRIRTHQKCTHPGCPNSIKGGGRGAKGTLAPEMTQKIVPNEDELGGLEGELGGVDARRTSNDSQTSSQRRHSAVEVTVPAPTQYMPPPSFSSSHDLFFPSHARAAEICRSTGRFGILKFYWKLVLMFAQPLLPIFYPMHSHFKMCSHPTRPLTVPAGTVVQRTLRGVRSMIGRLGIPSANPVIVSSSGTKSRQEAIRPFSASVATPEVDIEGTIRGNISNVDTNVFDGARYQDPSWRCKAGCDKICPGIPLKYRILACVYDPSLPIRRPMSAVNEPSFLMLPTTQILLYWFCYCFGLFIIPALIRPFFKIFYIRLLLGDVLRFAGMKGAGYQASSDFQFVLDEVTNAFNSPESSPFPAVSDTDEGPLNSITDPYEQLIVLGAGFDTSAISLGFKQRSSRQYSNSTSSSISPDVKVFEFDLSSTLHQKLRASAKLRSIYRTQHLADPYPVPETAIPKGMSFVADSLSNVTHVPIDLVSDDLFAVFEAAGCSRTAKTRIIFEGVSYYIPHDAIVNTLRGVTNYFDHGFLYMDWASAYFGNDDKEKNSWTEFDRQKWYLLRDSLAGMSSPLNTWLNHSFFNIDGCDVHLWGSNEVLSQLGSTPSGMADFQHAVIRW